jgi:GT2 family glycosyltransferase/glycosyltransferase involved in cell wall biosynthesis
MSLSLPAREVLKLRGQTNIAWAVFDPDWYLAAHPDARAMLADQPPEAVLAFYLEEGQRLGHAPNAVFDEAWHRRAYPAVMAAITRGHVESAFDSYCRGEHRTRPGHWLFNEKQYRRRYPDLTDEALDTGGFANGYDHYLRHGGAEGRFGHTLFDPDFYCRGLDEEAAERARAEGPFRHWLLHLPAQPAARTTPLFDPHWYRERYQAAAVAIDAGDWRCALHHYQYNETPMQFDPLPVFSEAWYLAGNPDVREAVEAGKFRNGYAHFLSHGAAELRSPCKAVDLRWYAAQDRVKSDLARGLAANAFLHLLLIGLPESLPLFPPEEERVTEGQAKTLFRRKAQVLLPRFGRDALDFTCAGKPLLSAVMVVHDKFALTLGALGSLRANFAGAMELILVDSGSTDETRHITRHVRGARCLRFDSNIGYLRGCNAALHHATADAVLLLNNDIELAPGAVAAALRRLDSDPSIGAVGGKVIRTHGVLQEAGNIIWRDGTTEGYLRGASPLAPEANFVRETDFCSGVFLLVRTALLRELDGFDEVFAPAYYEDADLCVRIAQSGARVMYDPAIVVHHLEYGSAINRNAADAAIAERRGIFARKHAAWLAAHPEKDAKALPLARFAGQTPHRVLFIEDMIPLQSIGSGFVRSNDLVRVMAEMGYAVTVFPVNGSRFDLAAVYADMPDSVEVLHDRSLEGLAPLLAARRDYYDTIWIARTHNLDRVLPVLQSAPGSLPPVLLDTEAIVAARDAALASLGGETFDLDTAIRQEFRNAAACRQIVAVSELEAGLLRKLGLGDPSVIGHMRELAPTSRPFAERAGLLFVGAMHRMDSPNYDSLCWFVDEVLPIVEQTLGWETRLTIVGYTAPEVVLDRFRDHSRITLRGALPQTAKLYDSHRVFVAPTRFAAGTPYKVFEAASFGLPCVTSGLLARQLGWRDDEEVLSAEVSDAEGFAARIVALYRDEALWQRIREGTLARLARENSRERYVKSIASVLGPARRGVRLRAVS